MFFQSHLSCFSPSPLHKRAKLTAECGDEERQHLHALPGIWRPCGAPCVCQQPQHQLSFDPKTLQLLRPSPAARARARSRFPDNWREARAGRPPRAAVTVGITLSRSVRRFLPLLPSNGLKSLCCQEQSEAAWFIQVPASSASDNNQNYHLGPSLISVMQKPPEGFWGALHWINDCTVDL